MEEILKILSKGRMGVNVRLESAGLYNEVLQLTSFLNNSYNTIKLSQRLWHIENNVFEVVICSVCNKNPANFRACHYEYVSCSKKCKTDKIKNTNLKRHGVEYYINSKAVHERIRESSIEKYGVDHPTKAEEVKKKKKFTMIERYGVENPALSETLKEKGISTMIERYGVENPGQLNKVKEINLQKEYDRLKNILGLKYLVKSIEKGKFIIFHNICNNDFTITKKLANQRIRFNNEICKICNPRHKCWSLKENHIFKIVKKIYHGKITANNKKILNNHRELDIFLPELNKAIEFNGTYIHADPRFYKANDMIYYKFAEDIWKRDEEKQRMCDELGIKLFVVWEHDWDNDPEKIKQEILNLIAA